MLLQGYHIRPNGNPVGLSASELVLWDFYHPPGRPVLKQRGAAGLQLCPDPPPSAHQPVLNMSCRVGLGMSCHLPSVFIFNKAHHSFTSHVASYSL